MPCQCPERPVGSKLGGVGKEVDAWAHRERGAEARGNFFVTQQWIPTLGQLNLVPVSAVLHPPPSFWQEVEGRSGGNLLSRQDQG